VTLKVGMVGDSQIGKTSLMVKYVEGSFDEDYIQTLGTAGAVVAGRRGRAADPRLRRPRTGGRRSGVNFMEKTISIRNTEITFSIWDLGGTDWRRPRRARAASRRRLPDGNAVPCLGLPGAAVAGQREFVNMLPLVCNDAHAILFMFDLSRKSTLNSIKEWFRQARGFNKVSPDLGRTAWAQRPQC